MALRKIYGDWNEHNIFSVFYGGVRGVGGSNHGELVGRNFPNDDHNKFPNKFYWWSCIEKWCKNFPCVVIVQIVHLW